MFQIRCDRFDALRSDRPWLFPALDPRHHLHVASSLSCIGEEPLLIERHPCLAVEFNCEILARPDCAGSRDPPYRFWCDRDCDFQLVAFLEFAVFLVRCGSLPRSRGVAVNECVEDVLAACFDPSGAFDGDGGLHFWLSRNVFL